MNEGIDYWPGTTIVKSNNNGFTSGFGEPINWGKCTSAAAAGVKCTANVEKSRKAGRDPGAFYGISRKADELLRHGGAYTKARSAPQDGTRGALALTFLKTGPKDCTRMAQLLGVGDRDARKVLDREMARGNVVKLYDSKPIRYALVGAA